MKNSIKLLLLIPTLSSALTLNEANIKVIQSNPDYIQKIKFFNATREDLEMATSAYLPSVDITAGTGNEDVNSASTSFVRENFLRDELTINLRENLFNGFNDVNEIDRQHMRLKSAAYDVINEANAITLKMTKAYIDVLKEKELLRIADENAQTHLKYFKEVEKKTDAGYSTLAELNQIASRLALADSAYLSQKIAFSNAKVRFTKVYSFEFDVDSLVKPEGIESFPKSVEDAYKVALENNPAIKANYYTLLAAHKNYNKSRANFYPKLDVDFSLSKNNNLSGVAGINDSASIMLRLNYNLYRGGADSALKQKNLSLMQEEEQKMLSTTRNIKELLQEAWNNYTLINEQIEFFQKHVNLSKSTVNSYQKEFSLGRRNLLDLLIAESEHNTARQAYATGEYRLLYAQYEIKNALGNLLSVFGIKLFDQVGLANNEIIIDKDSYKELNLD